MLAGTGEVTLLEPERHERPGPDPDLIDRAAQALGKAKSPLIFSGGGIISGGAWDELQRLAETLEAPVIMTEQRQGRALRPPPPGARPRARCPSWRRTPTSCCVVGTRFVQGIMAQIARRWLTAGQDGDPARRRRGGGRPQLQARRRHRRRREEGAGGAGRARRALQHARGRRDATSCCGLKQYLRRRRARTAAAGRLRAWRSAPSCRRTASSSRRAPRSATGRSACFPVYQPRTYFTSGYQGTLGYGFATALGAQVGLPDRKVVSINGDGGFFYNVQELSTMVQQQHPADRHRLQRQRLRQRQAHPADALRRPHDRLRPAQPGHAEAGRGLRRRGPARQLRRTSCRRRCATSSAATTRC